MEVNTSFTIEGLIVNKVGTVDGYTVYRAEEEKGCPSWATLFFTQRGIVKFQLEIHADTSQNVAYISEIDITEIKQ